MKCSTKEFNTYRQWVRRLKLKRMEEKAEVGEKTNEVRTRRLTDHELGVLEKNKENQFQAKKKRLEITRKEANERRRYMSKNIIT